MQAADEGADSWIGRRIAQLRRDRGWTLAVLAGRVGLSTTQLSRIESGARQSSVGTLIELARAFGITLSELVSEDNPPRYQVVRQGQRAERETSHGTVTALSGRYPKLEAMHLSLPAQTSAPPSQHGGEEWLYVLAGSVDVTIADDHLSLSAGDAVHFDSRTPHNVHNRTGKGADILLVATRA